MKRNINEESRRERIERFLEREIWSRVPKSELGRALSRAERDEILGYRPEGVVPSGGGRSGPP